MRAAWSIKINGRWYRAGETLPGITPEMKNEYTKRDIVRMNAARIKQLAAENGIETENISRAELIPILIEKLGL